MQACGARLEAPIGKFSSLFNIERDDWNGIVCLMFARQDWEKIRRHLPTNAPGVYILLGGGRAYIGEGDPAFDRLVSHVANKSFWRKAFVLVSTGGQLNKVHVQYLEARLCTELKYAYVLENKVAPKLPVMSRQDEISAVRHLQNTLDMLSALNILEGAPVVLNEPEVLPVQTPKVRHVDYALVLQAVMAAKCSKGEKVATAISLLRKGVRSSKNQLEEMGLKWDIERDALVISTSKRHQNKLTRVVRSRVPDYHEWLEILKSQSGVEDAVRVRMAGITTRAIRIPGILVEPFLP